MTTRERRLGELLLIRWTFGSCRMRRMLPTSINGFIYNNERVKRSGLKRGAKTLKEGLRRNHEGRNPAVQDSLERRGSRGSEKARARHPLPRPAGRSGLLSRASPR